MCRSKATNSGFIRKVTLRIVGLWVAALLGFYAAPKGYSQVNAEQVTAIGRNVLQMDDYMLAIHYFNLAIKAKDYLAEPYFLRALAKMKLDDFKGAEEDATKAINRSKYLSEAYRLRGFCRMQLQMDSLAMEDIEHGLAENPQDKELIYYRAIALFNLKRYEAADSALTKVMEDNPTLYEPVTARAQLRLERGDTLAALADFDLSLKINKAQEYPYAIQAQIYSQWEDWPKALVALDEVIRLYPDQPDLYLNRAFMRYKTDDYVGAMADYNQTLRIDPYNEAALFNRALLRCEVMELKGAAEDFSRVIELDRNNFHAHYNRAIIYIKTNQLVKAEPDIKFILAKYPRYYPAYYLLAEIRQMKGDERGAIKNIMIADDLVRKYVENPKKNPLDRPIIAEQSNSRGHRIKNKSKSGGKKDVKQEVQEEVDMLDRFNQLVTAPVEPQGVLSFNEKYKGRVQDRETSLAPQPLFTLSFDSPSQTLNSINNYFRELSDLNSRNYISEKIYLKNDEAAKSEEEIDNTFVMVEKYTDALSSSKTRAVDYIARGTLYLMLRNYESALSDFNSALEIMPDYTVALMGKGYALYKMADSKKESRRAVLDVYEKAVTQNPMLVYAWYNKGNLYYEAEDYRQAEENYSQALSLNSEFGEAYYNRGLARMKLGKKEDAFSDFSKAGELGIIQGYRVMKSLR